MKTLRFIAVLLLGSILPAAPARAESLEIQVVAVQGIVQVRDDEGQPWKKPVVGQKLPIGAEARTGPNSALQMTVGTTERFTLERMGVVKILQALQEGGKITTDMGMKYGRGGFEVQAGGVEHETTIRTPSATLAVRGSKGFLEEYPGRDPIAGSDEGHVAFVNAIGREIPLDPGNRIEGRQNGAADRGLVQGAFLPTGPMALFGPEGQLAAAYPGGPPPPGQGGPPPAGAMQQQGINSQTIGGDITFTTGFLSIFANFSSDSSSPVFLAMSVQLPSGAIVDANHLVDPHGALTYGGDRTSANSGNNQTLQVFGSTGPFEVGHYIVSWDSPGPNNSTIHTFHVGAQLGGGITTDLAGPAIITVPGNSRVSTGFDVPSRTSAP